MGSGGNLLTPAAEGSLLGWILSSDEIVAALLVLLLTPVLRILWLGASSAYQHLREWRALRVERFTLELGPVPLSDPCPVRLPDEIPIHCLLIRYGTDSYIARMASDRERLEGRRRHEISHHKLVLDRRDGSYSSEIRLKVHRRLGTQFKLFIEARDLEVAKTYRDLLAGAPNVQDASISSYGAKPKVWLLLRQFQPTPALDHPGGNILNNYWWPD
jgi:hypothetical protein